MAKDIWKEIESRQKQLNEQTKNWPDWKKNAISYQAQNKKA